MEKVKGRLGDIPETMLITLWAKATETQRSNALLHDEKAKEMMQQIDYDFAKFQKAKMSQVGCCIRTKLIDLETIDFIKRHPDAVAIQLGAGLDARYERLGQPKITHWFDLDLAEAIALRRHFLSESERNTFIAESMFDDGWIDKVKAFGKPTLIIIEGVLMYFEAEQVQALFRKLCTRLDKATILFDMLAFVAVGRARRHDALQKMDKTAEFKWSLADTYQMESWSDRLHVKKEYYMSDHDEGRFPLIFRILYKIPYFWHRFNQRIVRIQIGE